MTIRSKILACTAIATLGATAAYAQSVPVITGPVDRGAIETAYADYEYIEIRYGLTQVKVEAVDFDSGIKLEVIYGKGNGELIKAEQEAAGNYAGRSGVTERSVTRDFEDDGDDNTSDDSNGDDNTSDDNTSDDNTSDDNTSDDNTSGDSDDSSGGSDGDDD